MLLAKIWKFLAEKTPLRYPIKWSQQLILPGFDGLPLYDVLVFFGKSLQKGALITRASAVAFKFFLALFPGILFLFTLIPYVPIQNFQAKTLEGIQSLVPEEGYAIIQETIEDIVVRERGDLLSVGLLLTLYFASNGISALLKAFNLSYYTSDNRTWIARRALSLVLFILLILLVFSAVSLILFGENIFHFISESIYDPGSLSGWFLQGGRWLVIVGSFYLTISILYTFGATKATRWKFFSAGSTLATLFIILLSVAFAYYVHNFGNYNKFYGSLGTLIVLMLWIYYNCIILLIGYDLNVSINQASKGKKSIAWKKGEEG